MLELTAATTAPTTVTSGLHLHPSTPTSHINWGSRGYFDDEIGDLEAAGHTPTTAPGPLQGVSHYRVFRPAAPGVFSLVGATAYSETVERVGLCAISLGHQVGRLPEDLASGPDWRFSEYVPFMDGGFIHEPEPVQNRPLRLQVLGNRAMRLICHRLGLVQPKKLTGESVVPNLADLESDLVGDRILQAFLVPSKKFRH